MISLNANIGEHGEGDPIVVEIDDNVVRFVDSEGAPVTAVSCEITTEDNSQEDFDAFYAALAQCAKPDPDVQYAYTVYTDHDVTACVILTEPVRVIETGVEEGGIFDIRESLEALESLEVDHFYLTNPEPTPEPTVKVALAPACPFGLTHYGSTPYQERLIPGQNITLDGNVISATGGGGDASALGYKPFDLGGLTLKNDFFWGWAPEEGDPAWNGLWADVSSGYQQQPCATGVLTPYPARVDEPSYAQIEVAAFNNTFGPGDWVMDPEQTVEAVENAQKLVIVQIFNVDGAYGDENTKQRIDMGDAVSIPVQQLLWDVQFPAAASADFTPREEGYNTLEVATFADVSIELSCDFEVTQSGQQTTVSSVPAIYRYTGPVVTRVVQDEDPLIVYACCRPLGQGVGLLLMDTSEITCDSGTMVKLTAVGDAIPRRLRLQAMMCTPLTLG